MELLTLQYLIALFSAISGFFLALKPVRAFIAKIWKLTIGRNAAKLDNILAELRPNGGDSLRDSVNRIEHQQKGFEAFLSAQLNIQDVAIVRTDAAGKLTNVNRQYQRMMGYSLAEVMGEGWINCIHPEDRERVVDNWKDAVTAGREVSEDIKYLRADGTSFVAHANVYREVDDEGVIRGWLGIIVPLEADVPNCPHLDKCRINDK
jgi:PAS domain S-box-containing protein